MKEQIEKLEDQIKELKSAWEADLRVKYESAKHKDFNIGDVVTDGKRVGIVEWMENKPCNTTYDQGYMGVSLITDNRGFLAFAKRDDWELVTDPYYQSSHNINIDLTGIEIELLKYHLGGRNLNPCEVKSKLLDILDFLKTKPF